MAADLEASKESLPQTQRLQEGSIMAPTENVGSLRQMLAELQESKNALELKLKSEENNDPTKQQELKELKQEIEGLRQKIATPSLNHRLML